MPTAARESASHRSAHGGSGRRGGVGPGARRPASDRSPQALVERGWLMHLDLVVSTRRSLRGRRLAFVCSALAAASARRLRHRRSSCRGRRPDAVRRAVTTEPRRPGAVAVAGRTRATTPKRARALGAAVPARQRRPQRSRPRLGVQLAFDGEGRQRGGNDNPNDFLVSRVGSDRNRKPSAVRLLGMGREHTTAERRRLQFRLAAGEPKSFGPYNCFT